MATPQTKIVRFDSPGTHVWVVPANVSSGFLTMVAGGGGGCGHGGTLLYSGGGGGGGEFVIRLPVGLTPGASVTIVVGAGGAAGSNVAPPAAGCDAGDGGDSSFDGVYIVRGGKGGKQDTFMKGGAGGGTGGAPEAGGRGVDGIPGDYENSFFTGGSRGGGGDGLNLGAILKAGPCIHLPYPKITELYAGGIGAASPYGLGGTGGPANTSGGGYQPWSNGYEPSTYFVPGGQSIYPYGAGGGGGGGGLGSGGTNCTGANGARGMVEILYIEAT